MVTICSIFCWQALWEKQQSQAIKVIVLFTVLPAHFFLVNLLQDNFRQLLKFMLVYLSIPPNYIASGLEWAKFNSA